MTNKKNKIIKDKPAVKNVNKPAKLNSVKKETPKEYLKRISGISFYVYR